ncbi:Stk1 family PASTA domain-containing Ser/Thr kinase [Ligilactobacillus apodemi]|nr:Stk1 family PASTA domain-containing Ser/Thr kinase [Ligilactobacillus apodemi]MCR1900574.1 Stk1 family PASTA domain-containing Ser/Thr kinase [Ligilactobacillus apodemi]
MRSGYILGGRYQMIRTLGEGGMANVYLAHDLILKRDVAVKLLRLDLRDDKSAVRRFHREANSLIELDNPHIVEIFDVGEEQGMQYLVMEYVKGTDLKQYIEKNRPLSYEHVIKIMEQILNAVLEAHNHGIIHRDLKPQNILMDEAGNVKITDFGIAVAVAEETMTRTNTLMGSVHYISPEQARGSMITQQSDIYSLGIILFEMLTGHVPYDGETAVSIVLKHYRSQMPSPRLYDENIPQALENIVLHATAKNLAERYQNVREMAADLKTCLAEERKSEAKWRPQKVVDDETKILPDFFAADLAKKNLAETIEIHSDIANTKPPKLKKKGKKRKLVRFFVMFVILLILGVLAYLYFIPKEISMPNLKGMHQREAMQLLKSQKLTLGKVSYQYDSHYDAGCISATTPSSGTKIKQWSEVDIVLSKGVQKKAFGDYRRRSYSDVSQRLKKQGVTVKKKSQYSDSVARGEIIAQSISPTKKVDFSKTTVTFTVSKGPNTEGMRDLIGYTLSEVKAYAEECGLTLVVKKEKVTTEIEKNTVISQEPPVGTPLHAGDVLEVTVAKS